MFAGKNLDRGFAALATLIFALAISHGHAAAQASYSYTGHPFTIFSCGPSNPGPGTVGCSVPAPTNTNTTYTATDHITATLTLGSPLGPNLAFSDIGNLPGFSLTLNDGEHTVSTPLGTGQSLFASVATDANGNISQWQLGINTGGVENGGIVTFNFTDTNGPHVFDWGITACCDPSVPGNYGQNFSMPGTWNSAGPAGSVTSLISLVSNPSLQLTAGQISSFTDKLDNVLMSIQAGQYKQAINQLNSFINSVQSSIKTQKISAQTGTTLIDAANAIIAAL